MKLIDSDILKTRNASIDFYRGIAILLVVLFHYDYLIPFGFIGVDLFFVISGYLVSKALLKEIDNNKKTNWKNFFIKRATKILPSYYFFIIAGTMIARILFLENHSDQIIPLSEFPKYFLFYLNYDLNFAWSFENSWSLCVEEHFYLFLALFFFTFSLIKRKVILLKYSLLVLIVVSVLFKIVGHFYGWYTFSATHMRMDALFLGVLLSFQEINEKIITSNSKKFSLPGVCLLIITIVAYSLTEKDSFFHNSLLHTFAPISFYLIIRGTLFSQFHFFKFIRIIAYYSYNWYLWHAIVAFLFLNMLDLNLYISLPLYLFSSFAMAVLCTKLIEEPILKKRKILIKLFSFKND